MNLFSQPDARMSIAALACAILRHFGAPAPNPVCPALAGYLENAPRNVVLLLLDGLGQNILTRHLPPDSFLRRHQVDTLSSVFPPTTTAAATALETGLFPSQSGWLGWSVFWPPIGQNVALYPNTTDDGTPAAEVHIGNTFLPVTQLVSVLRERGIDAISTYQQGARTLEEIVDLVQTRCHAPGRHFVYAYLNEPDHHLHREGCGSEAVRQWLSRADGAMEKLENTCPDTLFLLTADHGFTDVEGLCLEDFPELEDTLPGAVNYNIAVKTRGEDITFLRKIIRGGADRSYGIEVAKLAGLPDKVVQRAKKVLRELEAENGVQYVAARKEEDQVSLAAMGEGEVLDALRRCQPDTLTPIEAMSLIYEWKQKLS